MIIYYSTLKYTKMLPVFLYFREKRHNGIKVEKGWYFAPHKGMLR